MRLKPARANRRRSRVSIHAPWEGCDTPASPSRLHTPRFNSRTLGRVRQDKGQASQPKACFNSRTLGRVRRASGVIAVVSGGFQFTHPGKGATQPPIILDKVFTVSIHAPWEGCDKLPDEMLDHANKVSIHAPWEGCDPYRTLLRIRSWCFNSRTLGRVRRSSISGLLAKVTVSIHAPWEGCDDTDDLRRRSFDVSIHAPWEGCDHSGIGSNSG